MLSIFKLTVQLKYIRAAAVSCKPTRNVKKDFLNGSPFILILLIKITC